MGVMEQIRSRSWDPFITDTGFRWSYTDLFRASLNQSHRSVGPGPVSGPFVLSLSKDRQIARTEGQ